MKYNSQYLLQRLNALMNRPGQANHCVCVTAKKKAISQYNYGKTNWQSIYCNISFTYFPSV